MEKWEETINKLFSFLRSQTLNKVIRDELEKIDISLSKKLTTALTFPIKKITTLRINFLNIIIFQNM